MQESAEAIKYYSDPFRLSEQQAQDCHYENGCDTGSDGPHEYWDYSKEKGTQSYDSYPFESRNGKCRYNEKEVISKVKDWGVVDNSIVGNIYR